MKRILCLDLGQKRVGVAISDPYRIFAQALDVINIRGKADLIGKLAKYFKVYDIDKVLIGCPLNKNGEKGKAASYAERIANFIQSHYKVEVVLWDERFTTKEAETYLKMLGEKRPKEVVDKLSAQIILQSYLERLRGEGGN